MEACLSVFDTIYVIVMSIGMSAGGSSSVC